MDPRTFVDDALEISVVGSFSRVGYAVRSRLFDWSEPPDDALAGKTALVTGPTSGLGLAATERLASLGARVVLVGRTESKLERVRSRLITRHGIDRYPIVVADMSSRDDVIAAVSAISHRERRLDVLVDNAGTIYPERELTADGVEATLATMVVNPFVFISGLLSLLRASDSARVISVVTGGMYAQALPLEDLQFTRGDYDGTRAYARVKRAQAAMAREWARRLRGTGIRVNAMHPGWADTPSLAGFLPGFYGLMKPLLRTPAEGADTIIWLATDPDAGARGGQLYLDRRPRPFDRVPATRLDAQDRRQLWVRVAGLAGIEDPLPA